MQIYNLCFIVKHGVDKLGITYQFSGLPGVYFANNICAILITNVI